jgi:hypothetical protein
MDSLSPRLHLASIGKEAEQPCGREGGGGAGRRRSKHSPHDDASRRPGRESMASSPLSSSGTTMGKATTGRATNPWRVRVDSSIFSADSSSSGREGRRAKLLRSEESTEAPSLGSAGESWVAKSASTGSTAQGWHQKAARRRRQLLGADADGGAYGSGSGDLMNAFATPLL